MKKLLTTSLLFLVGSNFVHATHLMGSDMQYTYLGNSKYRITAKIYRDCRGIPMITPSFVVTAGKNGGTACGVYTLAIKLRSIRDITPVCSTQPKPCSPQNTTLGKLGVEEHIYDTVVDFSVAPLSNFVGNASCGEVTFLIGQCCRNGSITTGPANQDFWTSCTINLANLNIVSPSATNNSPKFSNFPIIFTCCNKPYRYNHGSMDSMEQDSISYRIVPGLRTNTGTPVNYSGSFSEKYPLTAYCPTAGVINCTPKPNLNPPQGFFLDTSNGDLVFTPVNCVEVAVVAIEVTEYRKTPTGTWVWIGKSRRDIEIAMRNDCDNNNPPVITGTRKIYACPGDSICYTYTLTDSTAAGQSKPDTVSVAWNKGIPGATFKIKDAKLREKEAVFCWKIPQNIQGQTFNFTITVEDQACPLKNLTIAGVNVYLCDRIAMVQKAKAQTFRIYPQPSAAGQPLMGLQKGAAWEMYDISGRILYSGKDADVLRAPSIPGVYLLHSGRASAIIEVIP